MPTSSILKRIAVISLPAQPRFVAREKFVANINHSAEVRIFSIWGQFDNLLEVVSEPTEAIEIVVDRLTEGALNKPIFEALGNGKRIKLAEFYGMLRRQGHGQPDVLLVNGQTIIAYPEEFPDLVVSADWYPGLGGWNFGARSTSRLLKWDAGYLVLSRN